MTDREHGQVGAHECARVYAALLTAACERKTLTYKNVGQLMGLKVKGHQLGKQTGDLLIVISEQEHEQGRPLLSALVVRQSDGQAGGGFFALARRLGQLEGEDAASERVFWESEVQAVYQTWAHST